VHRQIRTEENRKYTNNADAFAVLPPVHIIIKVARNISIYEMTRHTKRVQIFFLNKFAVENF